MPENSQWTPIQVAWVSFVDSVQGLLVPRSDDRPLDQYLAFRDAVLALVRNDQFLMELNMTWPAIAAPPLTDTGSLLLLELQAFPHAVEVAKATEKPEEGKGWLKKMLGRASTVSGSVKDLMENLPPYAKNGITLFKEVVDLFSGKD